MGLLKVMRLGEVNVKKYCEILKESYMIIPDHVILDGGRKGLIESLGINELKKNAYFRRTGTNEVLLYIGRTVSNGVDCGIYCVIDHYTKRYDGIDINLVKELKKVNFYPASNGKNRYKTRTSSKEIERLGYEAGKNVPRIEQIIHSIKLGNVRIPQGYEIHHKANVYDQRDGMCLMVTKDRHREFHKEYGQSSNKDGKIFTNLEDVFKELDKTRKHKTTVTKRQADIKKSKRKQRLASNNI